MTALNTLPRLSLVQCLRLLAESDIGRVVYVNAAMPAIQPVSYLLGGNTVIFQAAKGAKLAAATRNSVVAFEVDDIDRATRTGWSVVGVGPCSAVTDPDELAELATRMPTSWGTNHAGHTLAIEMAYLSGRRITLANGLNADFHAA
jgi:nitroimidazol reductase NimA-like FMN-containing flavoprotein (pyridoxamine 5'-phosphate oxidase superfamily)